MAAPAPVAGFPQHLRRRHRVAKLANRQHTRFEKFEPFTACLGDPRLPTWGRDSGPFASTLSGTQPPTALVYKPVAK
jgi:hypothetical protein